MPQHSIELLQTRSRYIGRRCPVARTELTIGEQIVICNQKDEVFSWSALPVLKGRCPHCGQIVPVGEILDLSEEAHEEVIQLNKKKEEKSKSKPQYIPPRRPESFPLFWVFLCAILILIVVIGAIAGYPYLAQKLTTTRANVYPTETPEATKTKHPASATPEPSTNTPTPSLTPIATAAPTQKPSPTLTATPKGPSLMDTLVRPDDKMVMVYVPAGTFAMGGEDGSSDETPVHEVTLDAFWLDRTEVMNAQFKRCVEAGACDAPTICDWGTPTYGDTGKWEHPVVCVAWSNAVSYCAWAGGRLPMEAEWEYAAAGLESLVYPWGNDQRQGYANCTEDDCADGFAETSPVGSFPEGASWVGAVDMAGNVWEWVNDWYQRDYYGRSPSQNPTGPASGNTKVLRGGSWYGDWYDPRTSDRGNVVPTFRDYNLGFRCVGGAPGN